ncbi:MAG: helix-turn-helix domain-containing protein [Clostridiales bacterium]|jgi:sugar diacid utilization regulator|nr:helix-turn-helix domain-containing protein [Eubacteriales bacterium]MDH7566073.1 helix-turn-helix domain-containing protein [Clostridiales bacterium]
MRLSIETLSDKLNHYSPQVFISDKNNLSVRSAKFLINSITVFEPEVLYVGKVSGLASLLPLKGHANLLCISDADIFPEYKENPKLNLVVLPKTADIFQVFSEVQDIISTYQKFAQSSEKLLDTLIHGKGVQHIIDIGYELLGNPISFGDLSTKIIAYPKYTGPINSIWDEHIRNGYLTYDAMCSPEFKNMMKLVNRSKSPVLLKDAGKYDCISGKVTIDGIIVGYITVMGSEKPLKTSDIELVALLCEVISLEMQKDKFYKNTKGAVYESFIKDLLDGSVNDPEVIEKRAKSLELGLRENLCLIVVDIKHFNAQKTSLSHLRNTLENLVAYSRSVIYYDYVVLIVNCGEKNTLLERDLMLLEEFLANKQLHAGLSRHFNNLKDIPYYYKQALKAIELGMHHNGKKALFIYEDYAVNHLLDICSDHHVDLKEFCHPALFKLMEYDRKNNTSYTQTLYIYLSHKGNQIKSANALNIHRASIAYRIEKIEEIMDLKLDNIYTMHFLYFSFTILEYSNELRLTQATDISG